MGEGQATNAKYTVQHTGGSSVVTVSQAQRGGQWNELGVFTFAGGQDYAITLSDDANGTVVADAVYIVKVEELTDAVTWAPALPASGSYQVYARWTAGETRATDALYRIVHEGGTTEVTRNQRVGGGLWHYLGSYAFDPLSTPTVTLAANDNGSVAADAVRFVGGPGGATDVAYLHNDHLGTPQVMTDAAAQVLWWRDQTPFGQTVAEGGFSASPLRFPGQYADTESGLAYNYFRDYDPALGRYIQSDPIGLRGGLSTYGYVHGNPLRYTDPTGEIPLDTIPDVAFIGYDLVMISVEGCTNENLLALAADVTALAIPYFTGAGIGVRLAGSAERAGLQGTKCGVRGAGRAPSGGGRAIRSRYGDGTPVYQGEQPGRIQGPIEGAEGLHSVLRHDEVNGRTYQGREYDAAGNPVRDVDFTNPTFPNGVVRPGHPGPPHIHEWKVNDPRVGPSSGFRRGPPMPF